MRIQTLTQLLILVLAILIADSLAQVQQPKTVTDFYLAMPSENYSHPFGKQIKGIVAITKYRKSLIKIEDIKNGYLKIDPNENEGWSEIALFKKTDGSYLIAHSQVECGPACSGDVKFLTYADGNWTDVSKQFLPKLSREQKEIQPCLFELPRFGRILKMSCGNIEDESEEQRVFNFEWNGAKFISK